MASAIGFSCSYSGDDSMISPFVFSSLKTSWPICASSSWSGLGCSSEASRPPLPPPQDASPVKATRESTDTRISVNTLMVAPFAYDVGLEAQLRRTQAEKAQAPTSSHYVACQASVVPAAKIAATPLEKVVPWRRRHSVSWLQS